MSHTFNPAPQEAEAGGSFKFKASLVYIMSSIMARDTQSNHVLLGRMRRGDTWELGMIHSTYIFMYKTKKTQNLH